MIHSLAVPALLHGIPGGRVNMRGNNAAVLLYHKHKAGVIQTRQIKEITVREKPVIRVAGHMLFLTREKQRRGAVLQRGGKALSVTSVNRRLYHCLTPSERTLYSSKRIVLLI